MTSIRVDVTAEHIAAAGPAPEGFHADYRDPIERAIADVTGVDVDVSGDGDHPVNGVWGFMATVGATEGSTLIVELPAEANARCNAVWNGEEIEPFEFDLEIDDWLVALIAKAASTDEQATAVMAFERDDR